MIYHPFDLVGADGEPDSLAKSELVAAGVTLGAGVLASMMCHSHPVLAALGTMAVIDNAYALSRKERTWKAALKNLGQHAVASGTSAAMPRTHWWLPPLGYFAGATAANLVIDGHGNGIAERIAKKLKGEPETIEVTPVPSTVVKKELI